MNPEEVLNNWNIGKINNFKSVSTGIFNQTYFVKTQKNDYILQGLHPLLPRGATQNYALLTEFLTANHFPAQKVLASKSSGFLVGFNQKNWRLLKAVPGRVYLSPGDPKIIYEAGRLLGEFHKVLRKFDKPLQKTLPMFRYSAVFQKLQGYENRFLGSRDLKIRQAVEFLLTNLPKYFLPSGLPKRLIHTDPKISNFIFDKNNRAVSLVDLDTVQYLTPLYDLGDALRSFCGRKEDHRQNNFNLNNARLFLDGYQKTVKGFLNKSEKELIPRAVGLVILGLAARFLNDYIDDSYFGWDAKRYRSRQEHNLARALNQIALFRDFENKIKLMRI